MWIRASNLQFGILHMSTRYCVSDIGPIMALLGACRRGSILAVAMVTMVGMFSENPA